MSQDIQYLGQKLSSDFSRHHYGSKIFISSSPLMWSYLAKLGTPQTEQPLINHLVESLYSYLFEKIVDHLFPKKMVTIDTRMKEFHSEGIYEGPIIDPEERVVTVNLARAGTFPSHLFYNKLNHLMNPKKIRQDHFYVARSLNEKGEVVGVSASGSKIGGDVDNSIVLFPDPMGATGGTMSYVYDHYQKHVEGSPKLMIAAHLIITPEYLKRITEQCPDLYVFALRLDRGLSRKEVLSETPGKLWEQEKGLNDHQYIVPGAGGLGEILNNSYC